MPRFEVSLALRARFKTYCVTRVYGLGSLDLEVFTIQKVLGSGLFKLTRLCLQQPKKLGHRKSSKFSDTSDKDLDGTKSKDCWSMRDRWLNEQEVFSLNALQQHGAQHAGLLLVLARAKCN